MNLNVQQNLSKSILYLLNSFNSIELPIKISNNN